VNTYPCTSAQQGLNTVQPQDVYSKERTKANIYIRDTFLYLP